MPKCCMADDNITRKDFKSYRRNNKIHFILSLSCLDNSKVNSGVTLFTLQYNLPGIMRIWLPSSVHLPDNVALYCSESWTRSSSWNEWGCCEQIKAKTLLFRVQRTPLDVLWIKWTILHERKDIYIFRCILHLYWRLHCMCVCVLAISYQLQIVPLFFTKHWEWGRNVFLLYQCLRGERSSCRKMSRTNSDGPHLKPCLFS